MNKDDLQRILSKHRKWINSEEGGECAHLGGANLSGADLSNANLSGADLSDADLGGANLRYADLRYAHLSNANLGGADLSDADLGGANLRYADLSGANLGGANLGGANLGGADLGGAHLSNADLRRANLSNANLSNANLVTLHIGPYDVYVQPEHTRIGCQYHTSKQWLSFNPDDVACFAKDARELWETYGELVKSAIRIVQAEAEQRRQMKNKTPDAAALVEFEGQL